MLENITDTHLKFIFKGRTCLHLLLREIKRFSIDIDIIITNEISKDALSSTFQTIIDQSLFTHFEEQLRYRSEIPKAHFKFFYPSPLDDTEFCLRG
ncbi:nucleotidyl transferase AbiEii/AbiGii toxin family protein [Lacticaseibacillus paracasei]|uniref:nucleotidyl transferase AbiEii/AbiGii toxin family protein n=1 Tax=Lacticaseibacillus paracasei TaxID=1597 RepID=UPI0030D04FBA